MKKTKKIIVKDLEVVTFMLSPQQLQEGEDETNDKN